MRSLGDESSSKMEVSTNEGGFYFLLFFLLSNKIYILYTVLIVSMRLFDNKMLESICTVSVVGNAIHMYCCNYTQNYNTRTGITIPVWDPIIV